MCQTVDIFNILRNITIFFTIESDCSACEAGSASWARGRELGIYRLLGTCSRIYIHV